MKMWTVVYQLIILAPRPSDIIINEFTKCVNNAANINLESLEWVMLPNNNVLTVHHRTSFCNNKWWDSPQGCMQAGWVTRLSRRDSLGTLHLHMLLWPPPEHLLLASTCISDQATAAQWWLDPCTRKHYPGLHCSHVLCLCCVGLHCHSAAGRQQVGAKQAAAACGLLNGTQDGLLTT